MEIRKISKVENKDRIRLSFYIISTLFTIMQLIFSYIDMGGKFNLYNLLHYISSIFLLISITCSIYFNKKYPFVAFLIITGILWIINCALPFMAYNSALREDFYDINIFLGVTTMFSTFSFIAITGIMY